MKGQVKNKVLFVFALLFGLMFINSGLNKFLNYMPVPKDLPEKMMQAFSGIMNLGWLMPLVGIAEITGGVLIIIPKTRALGALVIFPVMVGIILTGIFQNPGTLPFVLILGAILAWVIYDNRNKYLQLLG